MNAPILGTKIDVAYRFIKQRILRGEYSPGHRLVLDRIAREAEISQVPVREAMRRLEAEGYVVYEHNAGARVAELDAAAYDSIQYMIAVLEGAATARAAPYLGLDEIEQAILLNQKMKRCREDYDAEGFIRLNEEFHHILCGACPDQYLLEQLERERARMSLIRRPTLSTIMRLSSVFVTDHDELIALIKEEPHSSKIQLRAQAHKVRMLDALRNDTPATGRIGAVSSR